MKRSLPESPQQNTLSGNRSNRLYRMLSVVISLILLNLAAPGYAQDTLQSGIDVAGPKQQGNPDSLPPHLPPDGASLDLDFPEILNYDEVLGNLRYPAMARDYGIEGTVIVRVLVDEEGNYARHVVLKDPHPSLTKTVEKRLPYLKFAHEPDLTPVKSWLTIRVKFNLK